MSDQTDTTLSGGEDFPKEALEKISEHQIQNSGSYEPITKIAINQSKLWHLTKGKKTSQKMESMGFKMDTGEIFF